jgi:hypothetical protein
LLLLLLLLCPRTGRSQSAKGRDPAAVPADGNSADDPTFDRVEGVTFIYFSADFWIFVYQYLADRWIVLFHLIPSL